MTLAAVAFHGVASSIGAWRRDVRRNARRARASCRVGPLSSVRRPLPATLFGDALLSLCGDRLRGALEAPYVAPTSPAVERERRPRVPNALPLSSTDAERTSSSRSKAADANASRAWQQLGEQDAGARAARVGENSHARLSVDVPSPLAIALCRLQAVSAPSVPAAAPTTSAPVPLPRHDAVATRETSPANLTQRSPLMRSAEDDRGSPTRDGAALLHVSSASRQPWWTSGVDEIHSRNVQRTPVARPVAATMDAPEEAFAEMLADVLRQQAIQHGVLVP